jgi:hypothetical protein
MRVVLLIALLASGCSEYIVPRSAYDRAMAMSLEERMRTAVPAKSGSQPVDTWLKAWTLWRATSTPQGRDMLLRGQPSRSLVAIGSVLIAAGAALVIAGGVVYGREVVDANRCRAEGGPLCGFGSGSTMAIGIVGAPVLIAGAITLGVGASRAPEEINHGVPGIQYVASTPVPPPSP